MSTIDLTQDVRNGILKALVDLNSLNKNSFPMNDDEIDSIIQDTLTYLREEN